MIVLSDLPISPNGKNGWPWTEGSHLHVDSGLLKLPKISIVTPSFNQGEFIEETIRSVLLQGYPNFEYMIIDGGSSDDSVEIIKKYEKWITYWVSEKDRGQSDAINKGLKMATGNLLAWINSDDLLNSDAFWTVSRKYQPASGVAMYIGKTQEIDKSGALLRLLTPRIKDKELIGNWGTGADADCHFHQPSVFFDAEMFRTVGGVNEKHHIAMDVELWMKLAQQGGVSILDEVLSFARIYPEAKTFNDIDRVFVEMIALNFNMGKTDIAKHYLKRYIGYVNWKNNKG